MFGLFDDWPFEGFSGFLERIASEFRIVHDESIGYGLIGPEQDEYFYFYCLKYK
jgi:hypothetical protein